MPFEARCLYAVREATFASQLDATGHQRQKYEPAPATDYLGGNRFERRTTTNSLTTKLSATRHPLGTNRRDLQTVRDSGRAKSIEKDSQ
ncbi:hypothetical protein C7B80_01645 [Cyanosarcina cf. burmensis CCALA 770]|nr:hypothetical protein C7B80_01645 [Cyanosarcina cf. burmensis CCALA 770]